MNLFEPRKILVPVDFGPVADHAIGFATTVASKFDAELTLLYADTFLPPPYFTAGRVDDIAATLANSKDLAREQLQKLAAERIPGGVSVSTAVIEALPAGAIIEYAQKHGSDLVVMGTHGRSGVSRFMLGSVAEQVLHEIDIPVLTVRPDANPHEVPQRIICPFNFTPVAREALAHAVSLAQRFDAQLDLLHVAEDGRSAEAAEQEMKNLCAWLPAGQTAKCHVEELPKGGDPAETILRFAKGADLLVIGAQHRRFTDTTVLGSTSVRIVRYAPTAVLTVIRKEQVKEAAA